MLAMVSMTSQHSSVPKKRHETVGSSSLGYSTDLDLAQDNPLYESTDNLADGADLPAANDGYAVDHANAAPDAEDGGYLDVNAE